MQANLPEPRLLEIDGGFGVTLFKNELPDLPQNSINLNGRQLKAIEFIKSKGKISSKAYQELNSCSRNLARYDLALLVKKGVLISNNIKGAGAFYILK